MKLNIIGKRELSVNYLNLPYYLNKYLGELPDPPLDPKTKQPIGPEALAALFPMELIKQEVSLEKEIPIPDEVRELYVTYRPTPLLRAKRLEKLLDTPARIYFKYDGVSPVGSHKLNTALAQAYFNKKKELPVCRRKPAPDNGERACTCMQALWIILSGVYGTYFI
jgi:tryptophan synthase beta chain